MFIVGGFFFFFFMVCIVLWGGEFMTDRGMHCVVKIDIWRDVTGACRDLLFEVKC